jgi:uncharacterized protein (DUF4415 family)
MKQRKRVTKRAKAAKRVTRKVRKLTASAEVRKPPKSLPEELAGMYRPVKRPVTLRLDADIVAWYQREGRGYQTRINRALRKAMAQEKRAAARA